MADLEKLQTNYEAHLRNARQMEDLAASADPAGRERLLDVAANCRAHAYELQSRYGLRGSEPVLSRAVYPSPHRLADLAPVQSSATEPEPEQQRPALEVSPRAARVARELAAIDAKLTMPAAEIEAIALKLAGGRGNPGRKASELVKFWKRRRATLLAEQAGETAVPVQISATEQQPPAAFVERVKVYPTIAAAFLQDDPRHPGRTLADVGRVYHLALAYDEKGSGALPLKSFYADLRAATGQTRRTFANAIRRGVGIAWEINNGYLVRYAPDRISNALGAGTLSGRPVYVPTRHFLGGMQSTKAALYATFDGGRKERPISQQVKRQLTGIPERTQYVYDRLAGTKITYNIAQGGEATSENLKRLEALHGRATFVITATGTRKRNRVQVPRIAWHLPNSYTSAFAAAPRGRQRKHNEKIGLVKSQRVTDPNIMRAYHPTAADAVGAAARRPGSAHYYENGRTLTISARTPSRLQGAALWQCIY